MSCDPYSWFAEMQKKLFHDYLHERKIQLKARQLMAAPIERMRMPWRNEFNTTDCGVYAMRHMETYMGTKLKEWECGLKKRSKKQLRFLRAKFCAAILSAENNDHNVDNILAAKEYVLKCNEGGPIDIETFVATYQKGAGEVTETSKSNV